MPLLLNHPFTICLGRIVTSMDNQILRPVIQLACQVALEDGLGAGGITLLGVDRSARHVGHHGVAAAKGVLGGAQHVVGGRRLGEPDIAAIAAEVA